MENKFKRFLSLLMAVFMVLSMIPANPVHVHAADTVNAVGITAAGGSAKLNYATLGSASGHSVDSTKKAIKLGANGYLALKLHDDVKEGFLTDLNGKATIEIEVLSSYAAYFKGYYTNVEGTKTDLPAYSYLKAGSSADTTIAVYELNDAGLDGTIWGSNEAVGVQQTGDNYAYIRSIKIIRGVDTTAPTVGQDAGTNCGNPSAVTLQNATTFDKKVSVSVRVKMSEETTWPDWTPIVTDYIMEAGTKETVASSAWLLEKMPANGTYNVQVGVTWNGKSFTKTATYVREDHTYDNDCDAECNVCGATRTVGDHTPGTAVKENEVAATCTTAGSYDNVTYCTVCGVETSRETVTVGTTGEHDYVDGVCSVCGAQVTSGYLLYILNGDGTVGMAIDGSKSASEFSLKSAIEDARVFADNGFLFGITGTPSFIVEMYEDSNEDESFTIAADVTIKGNGHSIILAEGVTLDASAATLNDVTIVEPKPEVTYVAQIGEDKFETLEAAFAAATEGQTIVLLTDAAPALTSQRAITKAAVIDLNGNTLTLAEDDLYFGTTTFTNGKIVVDPSVKASTAVFWMFAGQTLTFDNVEIVATGVTGTYLIGINGDSGSAVNLLNGSKITIANTEQAGLTAVIADNGTGNSVVIENSDIDVANIEGRFYLGGASGSVTVKDSDINLNGVKEGFYLRAGQTLSIEGTSTVNVALNSTEGRYGINVTDKTATYTKADTATVNATVYKPITYVAEVNGVQYTDLQEAIIAAAPSGTVTLLTDVTVDKWIMFSQRLTIGSGQIITLDMDGLTINGNNHTLTVNSIESASNGNRLFHEADNLVIKDLTINYADGVVGGISLKSGELNNVTFNGGVGVLPGTGAITITGCEFNTSGSAIYYEEDRDNLVVTGNTFNTAAGQYAIYLRGKTTFTGNTVVSGKVNVVNGSPVVTGNDFGDERFKVYNGATATISYNTINNLVFNDETVQQSTFTDNTLSESAQAALAAVSGLNGSGTETDPYLINDLDDLIWFRDTVDNVQSDRSNQFVGKYVKLNADIDLAGINWNPIGEKKDHGSFMGIFDGGNHTISNLYVEQAGEYLGLFAYAGSFSETEQAVIKNLTLENVTVKSTNNSNYVGGVVGNATTTDFENVHVTGTVEISGRGYIGGIVGHGYSNFNNVSVKATNGTISSTFWCAGGVIGYLGEGSTIKNAVVEGLTIKSAAGGLGSVVGMASSNNGTQPCTGENLSAKNVVIQTYTGAYGDSYAEYALGYLIGGDTSVMTGSNTAENVTFVCSNGSTNPAVSDAVASVDGAIYFNLQEAVNVGGEVTLLTDVTLTEILNITTALNLDLNGKTITSTAKCAVQVSGGNADLAVKISNGKIVVGAGSASNGTSALSVYDGADVTVENVALSGGYYGIKLAGYSSYPSDVTKNNLTSVVLNGGSVTAENAAIIGLGAYPNTQIDINNAVVTSTDSIAIYHPSYGTLNISGEETVITGATAIYLKAGILNISDGKIVANGEYAEYEYEYSGAKTTGDAVVIESCNYGGYPTPVVSITGGSFTSANNKAVVSYHSDDAVAVTGFISGGTFDKAPAEEYIAEGYEFDAETGTVVEALRDLEGSGTAEAPYLISSVEDFIIFAKQTQNGNTYSGKIIKLANDIDFAGANYLEIAEDGTIVTDYRIPKFSGTFDGDGHTIKNFNFVVKASGKYSIMMFTQDGMWAYIKNLNIENVSVSVADITGETRISALANRVNAGGMTSAAIENVHIKNFEVTVKNPTSSKLNISGFAYFVQGSQLVIKNSSIEGFVVNAPSAYIVGGAVGVIKSKCDMENVDVEAEFNIGNVELIGGFAGQTQDKGTGTTFTDCDVKIQMTLGNSGSDIGGFIGQIGSVSQFYNCTATGSINVTNGTSALSVGGFAGNLGWNGMYEPNVQHEFNDCVADVDITAVNANVGGFIGNSTVAGYPERFMPTYFNNCEAKGDVKTVNGVAGGFVGHGDRGIFNNCSASGNVEGRIAGGFWGEIYPKVKAEFSGGWSYQNKEVTHTDANAKSIVLDSVSATGAVAGTEYEAGIIGFMKDIYVNADETLGYATPVVLNNTPAEYNRYKYPAKTYEVSTKAELDAALADAQEDDIILLIADIDYGTTQLKIEKAITLDLGGKTLTTRNAYGGMSVKNNPTIKNGTIVHASNTAAIKVWNATAFEDLIIDVQGKGDANKTIGGIVLQEGSTTRVGSIKNVTIKGDALTNGIETYNCGNATENVIGSMENVTIDANGTGMLISAPCGTATNCSISGDVNGIEIWIKGTYSASLDLENSTVEGGVFAHDEFNSNPSIVNNGTLKLTADEATTGVDADDITLTIARAEKVEGVLEEVMTNAKAKVNDTYYATFAAALAAAQPGDTVTILAGEYTTNLNVNKAITVVGETDAEGNNLVNITGKLNITADGATVKNINVNNGSSSAGYIGAKDVLVEGCTVVGGNGFRSCYTTGTVTFKDSTITGSTYGIHFDGSAGGNIVIDNCVITGWTSFASTIEKVTLTDTTFAEGNYNKLRFYQDAELTNVKFNEEMSIDFGVDGVSADFTGCSVTDGSSLLDVIYLADIAEMGVNVTIDGEKINIVAKIGDVYYQTLAEAVAAAKTGDTINLLADVTIAADETIALNGVNLISNEGVKLTNNGTVLVSGASDIAANVTGSGWFHMDGVTMTAATKLYGAKVRFVNGTNNINGSVIDDGFFQVGVGEYHGTDSRTEKTDVVVNVKNAYIGSNGETYSGWVGTGWFEDDATKAEAMTNAKYVLNIEDSIAEFGYVHVSNDGELNVKGNAATKVWYNNSDYSFYAGNLIVNGTATFDSTDVLALFTNVSCDNGTNKPGTVNIVNGTYFEAERHNGAVDGTNFEIRKTGVVNVNGAELYVGENASIAATAKLNITNAKATVVGTITNNGTVLVSGTSDIAANVTGSGWFYMNGVTMSAATKLYGAKVGFISGTNNIVGSIIEDGWFSVGIGQNATAATTAEFAAANGITLGDVTVNVSGDAIIGNGSDAAYSGWIGSAYSADKTQYKYVLNVENSLATFGYLHISKDGVLNVKGHATNKYTHDGANVDFYAGNFIVNGVVNLDGTDAWVRWISLSADHADGVVNVINGTKLEASRHIGSNTGYALKFFKAGEFNVDATSVVEIDNEITMLEGAKLNIAGEVIANGAVTGNGTISLTNVNATFKATENLTVTTNVEDYKVSYADGVYKLVAKEYVAKVGEQKFESLAEAIAAANGGEVEILCDVTESLSEIKNVTLTTKVEDGVTVTNTDTENWISMTNVTIGSGVTLDMDNAYYTGAGVNVIEGTLKVGTLYNANDSKTTVQNGGKIITTGMIVNRYHTDPDAGIYVYGDGDNTTVEVSCADTIGTYSGTFYAKDAVIEGNMLWIDYKKGSTEEADKYTQSKPVFENSVVSIAEELRLYKDATLTLTNSTVTAGTVQVRENATPVVTMTGSTIKATSVLNLPGASLDAVLGEDGTVTFQKPVAKIGDTKYYSLADAIKAANAGETVTILAGEYTTNLSINKAITVQGETDAEGNNLVKINGGIDITADGATVKNLTASDPATSGYNCTLYINAKDVVVEGCVITDYNAMRYCETDGKVTFKNCELTATGSWAIHFNGTTGGEIVVDGCEVNGWIAFAGDLEKVTLQDSTFTKGNYSGGRTYNDTVVIDGCTFEVGYKFDLASAGTEATVTNSQMSDGSSVVELFNKDDATTANNITIDGEPLLYVAKIGSTYYATLEEALAAVTDYTLIKLVDNATLDYNAREAYGRATTTDIIIDGQGFTLTLNQKDSDWSSIGMANAEGKLTLKNMTIEKTGYGDTSGAWNTHAIIFSCNVEMKDVTVNNGIAVQNGATLNNVTINEQGGYYGLWINGNGQTVTVNGGEINATNGGRGIKIADQYIDAPASVTLNVTDTKFNTAKKAAVLVSSTAGANVTASNVDITNVAADPVNFVWVDEDWAAYYGNVEVTGCTKAQEGEFSIEVKDEDGTILGYYKNLDDLFTSDLMNTTDDLTINLLGDVTAANKFDISDYQVGLNFVTSVEGGVTMTFAYADDWNQVRYMSIGKNVTLNAHYLSVYGGVFDIYGTVNADYFFSTASAVTVKKGGVLNATTGDATVQVKNNSWLEVYGTVNAGTVNVWNNNSRGSHLIVSGADAALNASQLHAWNNKSYTVTNEVVVEKGATLTATNFQADRGSEVTVDAATLTADSLTLGYGDNVGTLTVKNDGVLTNGVVLSLNSTVTGPENMNVTTNVADHKVVYENGQYKVVPKVYVAQIGEQKFESLQDAENAAKDGDTIVLLKDIELTSYVTFYDAAGARMVTLDMNGKTITLTERNYAALWVCDGLTITGNGKITADPAGDAPTEGNSSAYAITVGSRGVAGNLVIENGTFYSDDASVISVTHGSVTIKGGSFEAAGDMDLNCIDDMYTAGKATITVEGGTFVGFNPEENASEGQNTNFCAEGYIGVEDGNGNYIVREGVWVAKVGETKYESLQDAIDAAGEGDTVTLLTDLTIESDLSNAAKGLFNIAEDDKITIDLNGKTINVTDNSTGNFIVFYNYGELTIKNGNVNLTATNDRDWNAQSTIILNRGGNLTIESGTYTHNGGTDMAITVDNSANSFGDAYLTVNGGEISSTYVGVRMRMADPSLNGNPGNGVAYMTVNGGTIKGTSRGIWGQITNPSADELGALTVTGGTIEGGNQAINMGSDSNDNITVAISGNAVIKGVLTGDAADYAITGGTFSNEVPEEFCAEGYVCVQNTDGTYGVVPANTVYVAQNTTSEEYYKTVAEALNAAQAGETVKMIADSDETGAVLTMWKGITLDLNGFELTATYLIAVKGNFVVDNSEASTGLLIVAKDNLSLPQDNAELPFWNESNGYYFTTPAIKEYQRLVKQGANGFKFQFKPGISFNETSMNDVASQYIANNGLTDNGIKMVVRLSWTGSQGTTVTQNYEYTDDLIKQAYDGKSLSLTVSNLPAGTFTVRVVLISDAGVEVIGEALTYTVN